MPSFRRSFLTLTIAAAVLLAGCTTGEQDTRGADVDEDGLPDVDENNGWGVVAYRATGEAAYTVTSDPSKKDTDGDGLDDADEYRQRLDPRNVDTDGDGLLDGVSVCNPGAGGRSEGPTKTDPQDSSPDAPDFVDLGIVRDPSNPACFLGEKSVCEGDRGLDPLRWDTDADGLGDGEEKTGWRITVRGEERHVTTSPCNADTDGDGLLDGAERERGTDPTSRDTDRDGAFDAFDADPLWDLGLEVGLAELTFHGDAPAGATLRFVLNVHGNERVFTMPVGEPFEQNVTLSRNVDDTSVDSGSLTGTVFYRVLLEHEDGRVVDVDVGGHAWNGSHVRVEYDLVQESGRVSGASGTQDGPVVTTTGEDAAVTLRFTVTRE